jgi:hypothetical protein
MAAMQNVSLASSFMVKTNGTLKLGMWSLVKTQTIKYLNTTYKKELVRCDDGVVRGCFLSKLTYTEYVLT